MRRKQQGAPRARKPSERRRVPQPLIRHRVPSGRGATEQPNATDDGPAELSARFWVALCATGVAAGLLGAALMAILFSFEHLGFGAFGRAPGAFLSAVTRTSAARRVDVLLIAGAFGGPAWYLLRRFTPGESSEIDDSVWNGTGGLSFRRSLGTSVISEIVVGMGASLGREAGPKLMGGASGTVLAGWFGLTRAQRRLLVACGAGAGFAAVYNVPLGGALFTVEVLVGSVTLPTVLPALACSGIATLTSWVYLPSHATYLDLPAYHLSATVMTWSVIAGPLIGLVAAAFVRLVAWAAHHRARGTLLLIGPLVVFGILGLIGIRYPALFGNGKDLAEQAFLGQGALTALLALALLKPLVTSLCLGGGATGGLFTPTLSTGAALGGFLGLAWSHLWPGSPAGAFALVGAAAMLGAATQAPLSGLVLVLELTHTGFSLVVPMAVATALAAAVTRWIDGYSIYSARLAEPTRGRDSSSAGPGS